MTGDELRAIVLTPPPLPLPLIDRFLFERCVMMITGETGKGKSIISAQIGLSCSLPSPLFGQLAIATPRRVYFMQCEGSVEEQLRRLHFMQQAVGWNPDWLYWDARKADRLNVLSAASCKRKLDQIGNAFKEGVPDIVEIDPIYKVCGGDLAKAEPALALIDFCDELLARFKCAVVLIHHPHRDRQDQQGRKLIEDDSYYGHSFLKNHVEASYAFHQLPDGLTSQLKLLKKREDNMLPLLTLCYHPETYTVSMAPLDAPQSLKAQVEAYLYQLALAKQTTTFKEIVSKVGISSQFLRDLQADYRQQGLVEFHAFTGKSTIWEPKLPQQVSQHG